MPDPPLNLKNILKEEQKAKLSALDKDFYEKAHALFRELKTEIARTDPDDMKYGMLSDELAVAKITFEAVLEIRMGKIIKDASIRKSLKKKEEHDPENLILVEKELYDVLFAALVKWRREQLYDQVKTPAPLIQAAPEIIKKPDTPKDLSKDYITVRVLRDVPTFVGADEHNYTLGKEDIATVPVVNAMALIGRKAAVKIGVRA